jgi:hypothetical protein
MIPRLATKIGGLIKIYANTGENIARISHRLERKALFARLATEHIPINLWLVKVTRASIGIFGYALD